MASSIFTIQYLEDPTGFSEANIAHLVERLRMAADRFPFTHLLIGWQLPQLVLEACRLEAERLDLRFLRWQPLLTTDKGFATEPAWQVEGISGAKVPGYHSQPEFTFFCPNHPSAQEALLEHLGRLLKEGIFQGFFLDRVRFPSPSQDPTSDLGCFCKHCYRKAAGQGIDLEEIRQSITQRLKTKEGCLSYANMLLSRESEKPANRQDQALSQWIAFRQKSIGDFLARIAQPIREAGLDVGLDCFSPCLTRMVGQDLMTMRRSVDWIKLMTYAHTLAPAGIPYELSGLAHYLTRVCQMGDEGAMDVLRYSTGLPLPDSRHSLERQGLSSNALEVEVKRGIETVTGPVLAGIELVDLPGITHLDADQIRGDVAAIKRAGAHGLAVSWDLLHIPLERLELVSQIYFN